MNVDYKKFKETIGERFLIAIEIEDLIRQITYDINDIRNVDSLKESMFIEGLDISSELELQVKLLLDSYKECFNV